MHLKKRPTYFTKNGVRKAVYYTVDARQLAERGWVPEDQQEAAPKASIPAIAAEPVAVTGVPIPITKPEPPGPVIEPETAAEQDILSMTKAELIEYASQNGIEVDSHSLKSTILEAIVEATDG